MGDAAIYEDSLGANRSGRLSDAQQQELETGLRARHTGLTGLVSRRLDSRVEDVRAGVVESIEGAITKRERQKGFGGQEALPLRYEIYVANRDSGDQRFRCIGELWDRAPEAGYVRLYFLPRSRWAVNFEPIDGPAPDVSAAGFQGAAARFTEARKSGDEVGAAEAYAEVHAIEQAAAGPPPGAAPSEEPLERALIGSWRSAVMRLGLELREDGSFTAELPDGSRPEGRWSLEGSTLRADVPGAPIEAQAAVAGGRLVLTMDGQSLAFERAG
ncbi:MAG TPA: hypothetical protein VNV44_08615 [Solirubrobacteraceae bacterium]|jgi:hypothetical protein|nr:hypothetical protein [Solirubrobacteraceae bacterium]